MKPRLTPLILGSVLVLGAWSAYAGAQVDVRYVEPDNFSDLKSTWLTQENLLATLTTHLQKLGQKYLPEGQALQIEITDINLAGSIEYPHNGEPIRVLRAVTSPGIALRWRLKSAGENSPMQDVTLRDMAYLTRINQYSDGDPLRYEKQMLEDWFKRSFATKEK